MTGKGPSVQFLGAAGTVTGSKHLIRANGKTVLLDCGLFQGLKALRERNWSPLPTPASEIDAVVLSHAHIDHSGYLPRLVREGFEGPIYCTAATGALLTFLLKDSAYLQEEQAAHANKYKYSKHEPALPLYTIPDAVVTLEHVRQMETGTAFDVVEGVRATLRPAGHILGAATVSLEIEHGAGALRVVFSGDIGRYGSPILKDPEPVAHADVLLVEGTYGDKLHVPNPDEQLARIVSETADRGGALIVPAFAVGRSQEMLWRLKSLEDDGRIPSLPVYLDSPMAIGVTKLYRHACSDHDAEMREAYAHGEKPLTPQMLRVSSTPTESKAIHQVRGPIIIVSASGMISGGRVLHHLKRRLSEKRTTVMLTGYQAAGSRGRALQDGAKSVRIHGEDIRVRARVETVHGLSAHGDRAELLRWLGGFEDAPRLTFLVHGEPTVLDTFAEVLREQKGWRPAVARYRERVALV
jgi:metallo-beta-lactamase family protein